MTQAYWRPGGKGDAQRLVGICHGEGRDEIGSSVAQQADLERVMAQLRLPSSSHWQRSVAARTDGAAHHQGEPGVSYRSRRSSRNSIATRLLLASACPP
jgi:hypothetical protein